eukprot:6179573-Pleurochrysis_carterae.AAC.1
MPSPALRSAVAAPRAGRAFRQSRVGAQISCARDRRGDAALPHSRSGARAPAAAAAGTTSMEI